jgi:hypothetical protein
MNNKKKIKKPIKTEEQNSSHKHKLFSFKEHKIKQPESFDIGRFDYVNLKAGSLKFKSLYGRKSL